MNCLFIVLLCVILVSTIEAKSSNLPTAGYKSSEKKLARANLSKYTHVTAAAPVAVSNDLEANFYKFTGGMFSFFAMGMLIGQNRMFGPSALSPLLQYWTKNNDSPVTEWFARFFGIAMLVFYSGPKFFGASMGPFLKQSMMFNTLGMANMAHVYFTAPDDCTQMWVPQIILQAAICMVNYHLVTK